jgi:hypothetical protein
MQWKSPSSRRPKKAQMSKSKVKTILICFFDCKGTVHREFVPPGQTVNQKFYLQVLERLRQQVCHVRPELFPNKWILHHDNAPSHTELSVKEFWARNQSWSWNTPLTHQICVTSSSSLPGRIISIDHILKPWKRFRL